MLLALVGITCVGKSYYVEKISEKLGFKKVRTIRTRKKRPGEKNGLFMTKEEIEKLKAENKIAYSFDVFGGTYAYLSEDIYSKENMVFEMHYTTIDDWKKVRPDIKTIYIFPQDIDIAKSKITERNLEKSKEKERLLEMEEHYNNVISNEKLKNKFDYIIYNNYDKNSEDKILDLVKKILIEEKRRSVFPIDKKIYFEENDDFEKIIKEVLVRKTINRLTKISTGWTNIVYNAKTPDGEYFFRFPRDEFWSKTIIKDYIFSNYIYEKTNYNTVKLELKFDKQGRPFSMHKKIEGVTLAEKMNELTENEINNVSEDVAKFMYQLHKLDFSEKDLKTAYENIISKNEISLNDMNLELKNFLDELLKRHVSEEDMKFWKFKNNVKNENSTCLVHGDLNSSNILIDDNNKVTAFIDFGFGGVGNKYDDIARIIGRTPIEFKKSIINYYEDVSGQHLNIEALENEIETWKNIDNAYINYMKKIGIY